jgi:hypothetical protein
LSGWLLSSIERSKIKKERFKYGFILFHPHWFFSFLSSSYVCYSFRCYIKGRTSLDLNTVTYIFTHIAFFFFCLIQTYINHFSVWYEVVPRRTSLDLNTVTYFFRQIDFLLLSCSDVYYSFRYYISGRTSSYKSFPWSTITHVFLHSFINRSKGLYNKTNYLLTMF